MDSIQIYLFGYAFVLGACVGSFLNVCIARMPDEKSLIQPGSHCMKCKKSIRWYDNIPVISYFLLGGKCRDCGQQYSILYPMVELFTGMLFVAMLYVYGLSTVVIPYTFMLCCFIVGTVVDFQHRIIPDEISVGGMVFGLIFSAVYPDMHGVIQGVDQTVWLAHAKSLGFSALGVLVGGGFTFLIAMVGDFLFKKESMGGGDIKLMAMIGAFLGWKMALLAFFIAPFFGLFYGIVEMIRTKDSTIAYGPFLILGAITAMIWGNELLNWILNGYGMY